MSFHEDLSHGPVMHELLPKTPIPTVQILPLKNTAPAEPKTTRSSKNKPDKTDKQEKIDKAKTEKPKKPTNSERIDKIDRQMEFMMAAIARLVTVQAPPAPLPDRSSPPPAHQSLLLDHPPAVSPARTSTPKALRSVRRNLIPSDDQICDFDDEPIHSKAHSGPKVSG